MSNDPDKAKEYLGNEIEKLKECSPKIKYGYISLCEIPANLNALKNEYENKCFWIIEGYYRNRNSKDIVVANEEKLKEYINGLLK